jgi:hypothetical protein
MFALTRFSVAEFGKAFWARKAFGRRFGTPMARDFLWLTIFFFLCSFMLFLVVSARHGVWERFEQVLLGALPGTGPPVLVNHHFVERPERISSRILGLFAARFPGLSIVPMRRFDGKSGTIVLPGLTVPRQLTDTLNLSIERQREIERKIDQSQSWGVGSDGSNAPLRILALPSDAPLWRWALKGRVIDDGPFPMTIIANRALFSRHFRYEKYQSAVAVSQAAPCVIRSALPEESKPDELTSLVIEVKEGDLRTAFHAFNVIWVDSFPLPDQVAFIMPLSTVELLLAAESRPKLDVNLESRGQPSERIRRVWIRDIAGNQEIPGQFRQMARCLGATPSAAVASKSDLACGAEWDRKMDCELSETCLVPRWQDDGNDLMVTASRSWPLRSGHVASCAASAGLGAILSPTHPLKDQISFERNDKTPQFEWEGPGRVRVPCFALIESDYEPGRGNDHCRKVVGPDDKSTGTAWLAGYPDAMVYVKHRGLLDKALPASQSAAPQSVGNVPSDPKGVVAALLGWKPDGSPVFSLDPGYEGALVRFGVLSTLIDTISFPLFAGLVLLYLALSSVILATAFLHRRAQYGLLEMNGVRPLQIQYIVWLQIILSCSIGCAFGYALFAGAAYAVDILLFHSEIIKEAKLAIGLDVTTFLDKLSVGDIFLIWFLMSVTSCTLGLALLVLQGVTGSNAPIDLIKS